MIRRQWYEADSGLPPPGYSYGHPVAVLREMIRFLHEGLTTKEAETLAGEVINSIPRFVTDPSEWSWSAQIEMDTEKLCAILLEAAKPRHKWSRRIRLPLSD
jgi:hypothetical protein